MDKVSLQPNHLPLLRDDPLLLSREEKDRLRRLPEKTCLVRARWSELEPEQGKYSEDGYARLREGLICLLAAGIEPVLCLYAGEAPDWFIAMGGWDREDNLRCYLRYVGKTVRSVGHLAQRYITVDRANELARRSGSFNAGTRRVSCMACAHIRAYRLIRDLRRDHGWGDTSVGFGITMFPERPLHRGLLSPVGMPLSLYQTDVLRAMGRGDFPLPYHNILHVKPGLWCDFAAVTAKGAWHAGDALTCCARADAVLSVPVWLTDPY